MLLTDVDCLHQVEIVYKPTIPTTKRCIATFLAPGDEWLLDAMLKGLHSYGDCEECLICVFDFSHTDTSRNVIEQHNDVSIHCRAISDLHSASKSILYSVARVIDAEQYLCLDPDILILDSLQPVFALTTSTNDHSIYVCSEGNGYIKGTLESALRNFYGGEIEDIIRINSSFRDVAEYSFIINDGFFTGRRAALLALDTLVRSMKHTETWISKLWWRNQFLFNLALAQLNIAAALDDGYNYQLHWHQAAIAIINNQVDILWNGQQVKCAHFNGMSRTKHPAMQVHKLLDQEQIDRLTRLEEHSNYNIFVTALKRWIKYSGPEVLAWSFYDPSAIHIQDYTALPLLALLHYLIRSSGCTHVMETGTARGITAACIASALYNKADAQVVTFDPYPELYPEREALWAELPAAMKACIQLRSFHSIDGMNKALQQGEQYDAALLDSMHTEEYVWQEFQKAIILVKPSGLILIHDIRLIYATVDAAIKRIESEGYSVTRLWCDEEGKGEDEVLGLAIIENRKRI